MGSVLPVSSSYVLTALAGIVPGRLSFVVIGSGSHWAVRCGVLGGLWVGICLLSGYQFDNWIVASMG